MRLLNSEAKIKNKHIELSIIIPCKNEENYIGKLLDSIKKQRMPFGYEIIIADANSYDETLSVIKKHSYSLFNVKIIKGGLPAIGRNSGAKIAKGKYLLFLDADCHFDNPDLINKSVFQLKEQKAELAGALLGIKGDLWVRLIYFFCNMSVRLSKFDRPFVVGTYMLITKKAFDKAGRFNEELMHCEDYFLSKKIKPINFTIINDYIYTDNRRFKKMGKINMILYFVKNIINRNNISYFKKDINYWK